MPRTRVSFEMRQKARSLRNHATKAENLLWYELRDLKAGGVKFRRQAPIGPYIVDFVCPLLKLVVEVDGDTHETDSGKRHDANRDAYLKSLGYKVLRIDEPDVVNSAWHVAQMVREKASRLVGDPTRPLRGHPPLKGEGDVGAVAAKNGSEA
ncbi:endonuclease domain-containing protein [Aminobacter niigataensis]|uniref:endonuclease domain-containing protein n=1 Tax=Aminobacter niigataensis TaxID=83265 RepID=UPI0024CCD466|nr:endonuclease domain-containing protein [Aminobacter niigataensis]CAI2936216.1 putative Ribonuclease P [Aminobacter niigataensis]